MQSSKEQQGEIRKPSQENNAKKQRKTTEWERLDLKKIGNTKGTFHATMGTIKDRNSKDLTEAKEVKKRWLDFTEELYKKGLNDPDNHDGVIIRVSPGV